MKKKSKVIPLSSAAIAHQKFLKRMGVLPKQIAARKKEQVVLTLRIDTIDQIRKAYD